LYGDIPDCGNAFATKESGSQALKLKNKHLKNYSWRIVSAAVPIVVHDGIGRDDDIRRML